MPDIRESWCGMVATFFVRVVNQGSNTAVVDNELGKLGCVFADFADERGHVLGDVLVCVLQVRQHAWENLGLDEGTETRAQK